MRPGTGRSRCVRPASSGSGNPGDYRHNQSPCIFSRKNKLREQSSYQSKYNPTYHSKPCDSIHRLISHYYLPMIVPPSPSQMISMAFGIGIPWCEVKTCPMPTPASKPKAPKHPLHNTRAFQSRLVKWFDKEGKNYPWRETHDPWAVLVSEIMLQARIKVYATLTSKPSRSSKRHHQGPPGRIPPRVRKNTRSPGNRGLYRRCRGILCIRRAPADCRRQCRKGFFKAL